MKERVRLRAGGRCERCDESAGSAHHYLPRSRGGKDEEGNLIWLCFDCHRGVHDHTLQDWGEWIHNRET